MDKLIRADAPSLGHFDAALAGVVLAMSLPT